MSGLEFHVPSENGGQIVQVSYAADETEGKVVMRIYDGSDGSETYYVSRALVDDTGDYWFYGPDNKRWREVIATNQG